MNRLHEINDLLTMDEFFEKSHHEPVLLFKHNTTCSVSAFAFLQLTSFLENYPGKILCGMVFIQQSREISDMVASRLDVSHQCPQALLIRNSQAVWHDSHNNITQQNLFMRFNEGKG
jgi:bacillithiol system protein YtxJ